MTENADVEWLRQVCGKQSCDPGLPIGRARRILAHIDQLETGRVKDQLRIEELQSSVDGCAQRLAAEVSRRSVPDDRRPTVHEIAAQIASGIAAAPWAGDMIDKEIARSAYDAAAALVAEGRRRDGQG